MARMAAEGTRERILAVATRLFYDKGVRAVGMKQIIDAAGCGKNLLYGHFPSKTDLVAAYLAEFQQRREDAALAAMGAAGDDPGAQLVALASEVAQRAGDPGYRGCPFRNYLTEFPDHTDAPGRIGLAHLGAARARIGTLTGQLGVADPELLADRIWLVIDGLYAGATRPEAADTGTTAVRLVGELIAGAVDRP